MMSMRLLSDGDGVGVDGCISIQSVLQKTKPQGSMETVNILNEYLLFLN